MSVIVVVIVFVSMLIESHVSRSNERALRARGAVEPADDVYSAMAWTYPVSFLAMAAEGAVRGGPSLMVFGVGALVFGLGKGIKYWAIASLGPRWTFRVLVTPGAPLVTRGPYAWLRHPNYVGVVGEFVGAALLLGAPLTGTAATLGFAVLIRRRIVIEDRALGRDQPATKGV
jgi:methyltransferase